MELSTDIIILLKSPTIGEKITPIRVSSIPSALLQLAPGTDLRAEVLGRMVNGRTLMRVAGEVLTMELPESLTTADSVRMTFLGTEPRPTFSLSLRQNSPTPVEISQTGRWLGQLVQEGANAPIRPEQLGRLARLSEGPPLDTAQLAASLREALTTSGLFYESHLAEWAAGTRDLASIMQEPQATLSPRQDGSTTSPHAPSAAPAPAEGDQQLLPLAGTAKGEEPAAQPSPPSPESVAARQQQQPGAPSPEAQIPIGPETAGAETVPGGAVSGKELPPPITQTGRTTTNPSPATTAATPTATADSAAPAASAATRPIAGADRESGAETVQQSVSGQPAAARDGAATSPQAPTLPSPEAATTERPGRPHQPSQQTVATEAAAPRTAVPQQAGIMPAPVIQVAPQQPGQPQAVAGNVQQASPPDANREQAAATTPTGRDAAAATPSRQQPVSSPQHPQPPDEAVIEETNAPATAPSAKATHEAATGQRAERPEVADPRAATLIREQLAALNSGVVVWNGEAWPGQPLRWEVEDRDARHRDHSEGRWHSELKVELPHLGRVVASLKVRGKKLHLALTADSDATTNLMQQESPSLEERLAAAGLSLENMVIRHGSKE